MQLFDPLSNKYYTTVKAIATFSPKKENSIKIGLNTTGY